MGHRSSLCEPTLNGGVTLPSYLGGDACPIHSGQVFRLAICGHGAPGLITVGRERDETNSWQSITLDTDGATTRYKGVLESIGRALHDEATILLFGCRAGAHDMGTNLLVALSNIWPGRRVVGFTKVLTFGPGARVRSQDIGLLTKTQSAGETIPQETDVRLTDTATNGAIWKSCHGLPNSQSMQKLPKMECSSRILSAFGCPSDQPE
jgi:hypothetical protein